jgi:hypothetical protein
MIIATHGIISSAVGMTYTPPLDLYTGASMAYSLRKLRSAYTGSAISVRRSSDNVSTDIGFNSSGQLDTAALLSHCSSNSGYITKWYDQSGNGVNIEQITFSQQPMIVNSGSLITSSGSVCMQFDGVDDHLTVLNSVFSGTNKPISTYQVLEYSTLRYNENLTISRESGPSACEFIIPFRSDSNTLHGLSWRDSACTIKSNSFSIPTTGKQLLSQWSNGTTTSNNRNAINLVNNFNISVGNIVINNLTIGALKRNTLSGYAHMKSMEVILYPTNESSNISAMESNINSFYSIY